MYTITHKKGYSYILGSVRKMLLYRFKVKVPTKGACEENVLLVQLLLTVQSSMKVCTSYLKISSQELAHHIKSTSHSCLGGLMFHPQLTGLFK